MWNPYDPDLFNPEDKVSWYKTDTAYRCYFLFAGLLFAVFGLIPWVLGLVQYAAWLI